MNEMGINGWTDTYRWTDRWIKTNGWTDRWTRTNRWTERDIETSEWTDRGIEANGWTYKQMDRQKETIGWADMDKGHCQTTKISFCLLAILIICLNNCWNKV